jgi:hypothetical protein
VYLEALSPRVSENGVARSLERVCSVMLAVTQPPLHIANFLSARWVILQNSHHSLLLALRLRKRNQVGISAPLGLEI